MSTPEQGAATGMPPQAGPDAHASEADVAVQLAALRTHGAGRFDPARLHYLETLAQCAAAHEGAVRRLLQARLAQALTTFSERFERAREDAAALLERHSAHDPQAAQTLRQLHAAGDFRALQRQAVSLHTAEPQTALRALVRQLEQHAADTNPNTAPTHTAARPELKAIRNFRNTWSKLSVDRQVAQALEQAPKTAGPINSHMLVLRSLALMRDVAPDYLNRFMSYADTLLCLEQGDRDKREKEKPAAPKKQGARAARK